MRRNWRTHTLYHRIFHSIVVTCAYPRTTRVSSEIDSDNVLVDNFQPVHLSLLKIVDSELLPADVASVEVWTGQHVSGCHSQAERQQVVPVLRIKVETVLKSHSIFRTTPTSFRTLPTSFALCLLCLFSL